MKQIFRLNPTEDDLVALNAAMETCDTLSMRVAEESNKLEIFDTGKLRAMTELRQDAAYQNCLDTAGDGSINAAISNGVRIARDNPRKTVKPTVLQMQAHQKYQVVVRRNGEFYTCGFKKVPSVAIEGYLQQEGTFNNSIQITRDNGGFYVKVLSGTTTESTIKEGNTSSGLQIEPHVDPESPNNVTIADALRLANKSIQAAEHNLNSIKCVVNALIPLVASLESHNDETLRNDKQQIGLPDKGIQVVYFVQGAHDGKIKIGTTEDLSVRLRNLRKGQSQPLKLVGWMEGGAEAESSLHEKFRDDCKHNEWFAPSKQILQHIVDLTSNLYDKV